MADDNCKALDCADLISYNWKQWLTIFGEATGYTANINDTIEQHNCSFSVWKDLKLYSFIWYGHNNYW